MAVADIGCGDGQLTLELRARGHAVVPTELRAGPAERARAHLGEVRLGPGLEPLAPGEVEVAVVAGMGGNTIARILERSPGVAAALGRLVLQPMQRERELRAWLAGHAFEILDERVAVERGRSYTVLVVRPPR